MVQAQYSQGIVDDDNGVAQLMLDEKPQQRRAIAGRAPANVVARLGHNNRPFSWAKERLLNGGQQRLEIVSNHVPGVAILDSEAGQPV